MSGLRAVDTFELPGSLLQLVDVIGISAALALVEGWGGVGQLYVPQRARLGADHPLVRRLGAEAAGRLADHWGGDYLRSIPRCAGALRSLRDRAIVARLSAGEPAWRVALDAGITERQVWNIKKSARRAAEAAQHPLF